MPSKQETEVMRVIDDAMLIEGIIVMDKSHQTKIAANESINVVDLAPNAENLVLSFKSIVKIENLVGFENLTKLCLDNNSIEVIANLDSLRKLRWLDLSFNKIKKIEGLRSLTELEDLSLFSNKISDVDEIQFCPKLKCLSIGNNKIDSLDQIVKFRQLSDLKMLNLSGNPISQEADYKMIVLAYVNQLKYLDYQVVDQADVHQAKEQYHDELLDIEEKESVVHEKISRDKMMGDYVKQLMEASILFAHSLFDDMFNDDTEIEKLKHLPGIKEVVESFKSAFKANSDEYILVALEKYSVKKRDIENFEKAVNSVRTKDDHEYTTLIDSFTQSKKQSIELMMEATHREKLNIVKRLSDELDKVCDELMSIEIRQVEKYEVLADEFDNKMTELKVAALEMQNGFFRAVEKMEEDFAVNVKSVAVDLIERLAREELAEDYLDDEAMNLVQDREACMTVISASHDLHVGRILKREDEARALETRKCQEIVVNSNAFEKTRNRDHILQIHDFYSASKYQLNSLLSSDDDEGEDDI